MVETAPIVMRVLPLIEACTVKSEEMTAHRMIYTKVVSRTVIHFETQLYIYWTSHANLPVLGRS